MPTRATNLPRTRTGFYTINSAASSRNLLRERVLAMEAPGGARRRPKGTMAGSGPSIVTFSGEGPRRRSWRSPASQGRAEDERSTPSQARQPLRESLHHDADPRRGGVGQHPPRQHRTARRAKNRLQAATKATEPSGERYPLCGRRSIASPFSVLVRPEMRRLRTLRHRPVIRCQRVTVTNAVGLHLRAASKFAHLASGFRATIGVCRSWRPAGERQQRHGSLDARGR